MSAVLVIPDIHNNISRADTFIRRLAGRYDRIVFLGDFFDDFGDSPEVVKEVAEWLGESLKDPRRTHLVGNHDLAYLAPGPRTYCSGFSHEKMRVVAPALNAMPRQCFQAAVEVDGWLISHAGFHPSLADGRATGELVEFANFELRSFLVGHESPLFAVGYARGGRASIGGVTWLDWTQEFRPIAGIHQLLGHTPSDTVRAQWMVPGCKHVTKRAHRLDWIPKDFISRASTTTTNICLDAGLACVALVDGGNVTIVSEQVPGGEQVIVVD